MIYKMTFSKRLYHYWSIIIFIVGSFLFVGFMVNRFGPEDLNQFIFIATVVCLIFVLPTLYIHFQYYLYTYRDKLEVHPDQFIYEHKGKEISFQLKSIEHVIGYKTKPIIEKRLPWFPWDSYNFTELILKDGQSIIITCYLVNEPEFDSSEGAEIQIKEVFFPDLRRRKIK